LRPSIRSVGINQTQPDVIDIQMYTPRTAMTVVNSASGESLAANVVSYGPFGWQQFVKIICPTHMRAATCGNGITELLLSQWPDGVSHTNDSIAGMTVQGIMCRAVRGRFSFDAAVSGASSSPLTRRPREHRAQTAPIVSPVPQVDIQRPKRRNLVRQGRASLAAGFNAYRGIEKTLLSVWTPGHSGNFG
jgi:hypothetical protein